MGQQRISLSKIPSRLLKGLKYTMSRKTKNPAEAGIDLFRFLRDMDWSHIVPRGFAPSGFLYKQSASSMEFNLITAWLYYVMATQNDNAYPVIVSLTDLYNGIRSCIFKYYPSLWYKEGPDGKPIPHKQRWDNIGSNLVKQLDKLSLGALHEYRGYMVRDIMILDDQEDRAILVMPTLPPEYTEQEYDQMTMAYEEYRGIRNDPSFVLFEKIPAPAKEQPKPISIPEMENILNNLRAKAAARKNTTTNLVSSMLPKEGKLGEPLSNAADDWTTDGLLGLTLRRGVYEFVYSRMLLILAFVAKFDVEYDVADRSIIEKLSKLDGSKQPIIVDTLPWVNLSVRAGGLDHARDLETRLEKALLSAMGLSEESPKKVQGLLEFAEFEDVL